MVETREIVRGPDKQFSTLLSMERREHTQNMYHVLNRAVQFLPD